MKKQKKQQQKWIEQIFASKQARTNGVVRRKRTTVEKYASLAALKAAVVARGFHLMELTDQYVIVCDPSPMKLVVR